MSVIRFDKEQEIPGQMPANGQDWANYIGHFWNANEQIQVVLLFENMLNIDCVKKAVRLSVDAEPILGCRFVEDENLPYWKRLENVDSIEWCTFEKVQDMDESLKRILSQPFETQDHQLKVNVLRSEEADLMCIKLNHACCDGGGAKDYLNLLSSIYSHLCVDESYLPKLNIIGKRDTSKLFKAIGVSDPKTLLNPKVAALKPTWAFPNNGGDADRFKFSFSRIKSDEISTLHEFARKKQVTINDLILTAFYRTLFIMLQPEEKEPMEICVTVDLRRYLTGKKTDAICNLSGVENHRIAKIEGENNISTLERVSLTMKEIKNGNPGLHSAASMEMMTGIKYPNAVSFVKNAWNECLKSKKSTLNLSNIGIIADYPLKFGNNIVKDAYIVTPVFKSPSFMLGVSSYNRTLTFTVGYCEPQTDENDVETFLTILKKELLSFIADK